MSNFLDSVGLNKLVNKLKQFFQRRDIIININNSDGSWTVSNNPYEDIINNIGAANILVNVIESSYIQYKTTNVTFVIYDNNEIIVNCDVLSMLADDEVQDIYHFRLEITETEVNVYHTIQEHIYRDDVILTGTGGISKDKVAIYNDSTISSDNKQIVVTSIFNDDSTTLYAFPDSSDEIKDDADHILATTKNIEDATAKKEDKKIKCIISEVDNNWTININGTDYNVASDYANICNILKDNLDNLSFSIYRIDTYQISNVKNIHYFYIPYEADSSFQITLVFIYDNDGIDTEYININKLGIDVGTYGSEVFYYVDQLCISQLGIINNLQNTGDGNKYLSDDGTYKKLSYILPDSLTTVEPTITQSDYNVLKNAIDNNNKLLLSSNFPNINNYLFYNVAYININDTLIIKIDLYLDIYNYETFAIIINNDLTCFNDLYDKFIVPISSGDGTKYLTDDGSYKEINLDNYAKSDDLSTFETVVKRGAGWSEVGIESYENSVNYLRGGGCSIVEELVNLDNEVATAIDNKADKTKVVVVEPTTNADGVIECNLGNVAFDKIIKINQSNNGDYYGIQSLTITGFTGHGNYVNTTHHEVLIEWDCGKDDMTLTLPDVASFHWANNETPTFKAGWHYQLSVTYWAGTQSTRDHYLAVCVGFPCEVV